MSEKFLDGTNYKFIDVCHYRISDEEATRLAEATMLGRLPRQGYELEVRLDDGRTAWMNRTPYRYFNDAPARGWVWCIYAVRDPGEPYAGLAPGAPYTPPASPII